MLLPCLIMAIRHSRFRQFHKSNRPSATLSTLPTVKAMRDCFEKYLNLTIADGNASLDTLKTYRNRTAQFLSWSGATH